jgi:hypothetical protein
MANDEHVAQLVRGVAAWNAWRDENPNVLHPPRPRKCSGTRIGMLETANTVPGKAAAVGASRLTGDGGTGGAKIL